VQWLPPPVPSLSVSAAEATFEELHAVPQSRSETRYFEEYPTPRLRRRWRKEWPRAEEPGSTEKGGSQKLFYSPRGPSFPSRQVDSDLEGSTCHSDQQVGSHTSSSSRQTEPVRWDIEDWANTLYEEVVQLEEDRLDADWDLQRAHQERKRLHTDLEASRRRCAQLEQQVARAVQVAREASAELRRLQPEGEAAQQQQRASSPPGCTSLALACTLGGVSGGRLQEDPTLRHLVSRRVRRAVADVVRACGVAGMTAEHIALEEQLEGEPARISAVLDPPPGTSVAELLTKLTTSCTLLSTISTAVEGIACIEKAKLGPIVAHSLEVREQCENWQLKCRQLLDATREQRRAYDTLQEAHLTFVQSFGRLQQQHDDLKEQCGSLREQGREAQERLRMELERQAEEARAELKKLQVERSAPKVPFPGQDPMVLVKELLEVAQTLQREFVQQTRQYEQLATRTRSWQGEQLLALEDAEDIVNAQDQTYGSFRTLLGNARRDSANIGLDICFWRTQAEGRADTAAPSDDESQRGAAAKQRWRGRQVNYT